LAQELIPNSWSAICAISITIYCELGPGLFNFILPYSYGGVYANLFCIIALYFFSKYLHTERIIWLVVIAILCGLAFLSKQEYGISILGAIILSILRPSLTSLKSRFAKSLLVLAITSLTVILPLVYIAQYASWKILLESLFPASKLITLSNAPIFQNTPSDALFNSWITFRIFLISSLTILASIFIVNWIFQYKCFRNLIDISKSLDLPLKLLFSLMISQGLLAGLSQILRSSSTSIFQPLLNLGWVPFALILYLFFYIAKPISNRYSQLFLSLIIFALLLNSRWSFFVKFYGLYAGIVILISFVIFYKASNLFLKSTIAWQYLIICLLVGLSPALMNFSEYRFSVNSAHGTFFVKDESLANALNLAILTIDQSNVSSVLVLPEGNILNFLTQTHSPSRQITFLPHTLPTYKDQQEFIEQMRINSPQFIIYVDRDFKEWGYKTYSDFNPIVHNWITQNHNLLYLFTSLSGSIRIYS
jgi:hypothetical protein